MFSRKLVLGLIALIISLNFATRTKEFDLDNNFNIYDLDKNTGKSKLLRKGIEDQPDLLYKYPSQEIKKLVKEDEDMKTKEK